MLDLFSTKIAYAAVSVDKFVYRLNTRIIDPIIYILFALAVGFFIFGVLEFLINQANEEKKTTGKSHMLWGIVGLTIMLGVWTVIGIIKKTLGV